MNRSFRVLLLVLASGICAPRLVHAAPILYEVVFTLNSGGPIPSSGSFMYDDAVPEFSSFVVVWNGTPFDFVNPAFNPANSLANAPDNFGGGDCLLGGGAASMFAALDGTCEERHWQALEFGPTRLFEIGSLTKTYAAVRIDDAVVNPNAVLAEGTFLITGMVNSPIPEPATGVLTLLGLGGAALRRRRRARAGGVASQVQ